MTKHKRLISIAGTDIDRLSPMQLKESILKSEGRVICGQHLLFANAGLVRGVTNSELMFSFGADMVMLNTFNFDDDSKSLGLQGLSYQELRALCRRPIGVYMGCPGTDADVEDDLYDRGGMLATPEHVERAVGMGADFIVLGGNPGSGTRIADVLATTARVSYEGMDEEARKRLPSSFKVFSRHLPIRHACLALDTKEFTSPDDVTVGMRRAIVDFMFDHLEYLQGFDDIKVCYNDGQHSIARTIHGAVEYVLSKNAVILKKAPPADYRLGQAADYICTVELAALRYRDRRTTATDEKFFGSWSRFRRGVLKEVRAKRM